jgi:hypothetical protein
MKRISITLFIGVLVSLIGCGSARAQATAQISGTVQDASGAVLPGVDITATQTGTGISRTTITNETGSYTLPNLPLGPYRLAAGLPGFRTFVQTGILLQVGSNATLNIVLQVGEVTEQIEVQANAALVETRTLSVGQVMETARIMEFPLNGRNTQELVLLQGGASRVTTDAGGYTFGANRITISAAGSPDTSMEYALDGIRHIDPYDGLGLALPFPDALAEFKTEVGGMAAPTCNAKGQVTLKAPFVNNRIDPALFSPAAVKLAARLPKTDQALARTFRFLDTKLGVSSRGIQRVEQFQTWSDRHGSHLVPIRQGPHGAGPRIFQFALKYLF